jgi:putative hemolysin
MLFKKSSPFQLSGDLQYSKYSFINRAIEKVSGLSYLNELYQTLPSSMTSQQFLDRVFELFQVNYQYQMKELAYIPKNEGVIIVANHPFGAMEGMMLASLLYKVRPDIKIMANYLLLLIPLVAQKHRSIICVL